MLPSWLGECRSTLVTDCNVCESSVLEERGVTMRAIK